MPTRTRISAEDGIMIIISNRIFSMDCLWMDRI